ncbi:hypothetical protein CY34DRAFT_798024 [Suillus luteus UH-Slu-Lm8-n1]|uniref:Uncharacterized protein n=1 Tax=Suillus luteus UH-Slu-Lm8-n1 TaxID=930992 RepID=A0A0D0AE88_9AGAM|nr:hypothetical protein CY34DRAFT_798024 [Suillus luteus UH-Slu-Lm8-n1]
MSIGPAYMRYTSYWITRRRQTIFGRVTLPIVLYCVITDRECMNDVSAGRVSSKGPA